MSKGRPVVVVEYLEGPLDGETEVIGDVPQFLHVSRATQGVQRWVTYRRGVVSTEGPNRARAFYRWCGD